VIARAADRVVLRTPEEVPLAFELAPIGGRVLALGLDLLLIFAAVALIVAVLSEAIGTGLEVTDSELLVMSLAQLTTFLVWNFYFIATELRWRGRTVGKRVVGLRVVARDGGPLSAGHIFARNLTRDVETLLPMAVLLAPETVGLSSPWMIALAWLWLGIMAAMPLFNRLRARVGDLIGGTLVVNAPRESLLEDLVAETEEPAFRFTQEQLDLYGIHELQILEDVLRRYPRHIDPDLLATIAAKIQVKIGWAQGDAPPPEPYPFLRAFYAAQRGRLEHKLLFGQRQEHKVG